MSQRLRILSAAAAAFLAFATMPATIAYAQANPNLPNGASGRVHYDHKRDRGDDRGRWNRDRDRGHHGRWRDRDRPNRNTSGVTIDRRAGSGPSTSGGTYTGNISGSRDRGNGNYFYIDRNDGFASDTDNVVRNPSGPKVVNPASGNSACADEAGVCVIRPQ